VVIIEVEPKITEFDNFDCEPGTTFAKCNYEKELYPVNQPITRRPKYIAISDRGSNHITLLFKIDLFRSYLRKDKLFPKENP
jgi:hypothetical protein